MQEYEAGIIRTECRGNNIYIIHLSCNEITQEAKPGQFVQARACTGPAPFLRRTFSICGVDRMRGYVTLLIEVIGEGTELITTARRGDCLNVIGPTGNGFEWRENRHRSCVFVAGGVGAAPLIFLADTMQIPVLQSAVFLIGAQTAEAHAAYERLFDGSMTVKQATDDGSLGYHGLVTGLLDEHLELSKPDIIYTCGPKPMMKAVAARASNAGIECQVSMEENMACGIGACYGCVVQLTDGSMVRSCVNGPVFDANEVDW